MRRVSLTLFVKGLAALWSVCVEYVIDGDVLTVIAKQDHRWAISGRSHICLIRFQQFACYMCFQVIMLMAKIKMEW